MPWDLILVLQNLLLNFIVLIAEKKTIHVVIAVWLKYYVVPFFAVEIEIYIIQPNSIISSPLNFWKYRDSPTR